MRGRVFWNPAEHPELSDSQEWKREAPEVLLKPKSAGDIDPYNILLSDSDSALKVQNSCQDRLPHLLCSDCILLTALLARINGYRLHAVVSSEAGNAPFIILLASRNVLSALSGLFRGFAHVNLHCNRCMQLSRLEQTGT